jgi:hypothetical protein
MAGPTPAAPPAIIAPKSATKVKTYLWSVDAQGNLIKVEMSTAKKSFAALGHNDRVALDTYLISSGKMPSDSLRKTLWNSIIDGAVAQYKTGKQSTPWDVLGIMQSQTPGQIANTQYTAYDQSSADATLNIVAKNIGFDTTQLSDADRKSFADAISTEAKNSGKVTQKVTSTGGTETIVTPTTFDAKVFAENWLWSKVNLPDAAKLPTKAIASLGDVKKVLRGNGIDYLAPAEVNKLAIDLAAGKTNIQAINTRYRQDAIKNYPQLAQRLQDNPDLTVIDLAQPAVSAIAKWLEIDPTKIDLTNPYLDKYLRPDGVTGKQSTPSMADFITTLKNSPDAEKASWAIDGARSAATGLARAMGFGI